MLIGPIGRVKVSERSIDFAVPLGRRLAVVSGIASLLVDEPGECSQRANFIGRLCDLMPATVRPAPRPCLRTREKVSSIGRLGRLRSSEQVASLGRLSGPRAIGDTRRPFARGGAQWNSSPAPNLSGQWVALGSRPRPEFHAQSLGYPVCHLFPFLYRQSSRL
jgi:hypothetical protein